MDNAKVRVIENTLVKEKAGEKQISNADFFPAKLSKLEKLEKEEIFPIIADQSTIALFNIAEKIASTDATVLITGETGTGKEVLARYIHKKSNRSDRKFIAINCAAIPDTLLESELFGHERGAFTNAYQKRIGKFEEAQNGTILLDEISEMSLMLQAKLLRILQEKEFFRLGSNEKIKMNARIIATSNRDLQKSVVDGTFREDLFYRLNIIPLNISALRERRADIAPLAVFFCEKYSNSKKQLSETFLKILENKYWRGNVRELENYIYRLVILSDRNVIEYEDINADFDFNLSGISEQNEENSCSTGVESDASNFQDTKTLNQIEKEAILNALKKFKNNKTIVAEKLGISVRTLRYKLNTYLKEKNPEL